MDNEREKAFLQLLTRVTEKLGEVDFLLFQLLNERYFDRDYRYLTQKIEKMSEKAVKWTSAVSQKVSIINDDIKKKQLERKKDIEEQNKRHEELKRKETEEWNKRFNLKKGEGV